MCGPADLRLIQGLFVISSCIMDVGISVVALDIFMNNRGESGSRLSMCGVSTLHALTVLIMRAGSI
jgi:hypothetical protein